MATALLLMLTAPWQAGIAEDVGDDGAPDLNSGQDTDAGTEQNPDDDNHEYDEYGDIKVKPTPMPEQLEPEFDTGIYNPLTGRPVFEDQSHIRPWAVSVGNTPEAQPLWGISRADMIIEYTVEGSTRLMVVYQDIATAGTIRGIRSFRTSSMEIAASLDAIHSHWGGRTYDNEEVHGNPATRWGTIDAESELVGYRVSRSVLDIDLEHRGAAIGEKLLSVVPDTFRKERNAGFEQPFTFVEDGAPAGGMPAANATISFYPGYKTTSFEYNADEGVYYPKQYRGDAYITDGIDGRRISFTNVLILQTSIPTVRVNESTSHLKIRTDGEGTGYFMCGGKYTEINWSRPNTTSPYTFTLADGSPLEIGIGKTYVCYVRSDQTQEFN